MKYILMINLMWISFAYSSGTHLGGHHKEKAHWDAPKNEASKKNPIHTSKKSINRGSALYQKNCSSCHGINANGDGKVGNSFKIKPTNLKKMSGKHKDGDFFWKIKVGKDDMPSWENKLSSNQMWDLVNFIQSLSKHDKGHH